MLIAEKSKYRKKIQRTDTNNLLNLKFDNSY